VPETLAEDYSFGQSPFAYQVLTVIPGRDINDVIPTLDDKQLKAIAGQLSHVFHSLLSLSPSATQVKINRKAKVRSGLRFCDSLGVARQIQLRGTLTPPRRKAG